MVIKISLRFSKAKTKNDEDKSSGPDHSKTSFIAYYYLGPLKKQRVTNKQRDWIDQNWITE